MSKTQSLISILKRDIVDIYRHGVDAVKPEKLINNAFEFDGKKLSLNAGYPNNSFDIDVAKNNVHIIGFGKSALSMTKSLINSIMESRLENSFRRGFLIVPMSLKKRFADDSELQKLLKSFDIICRFGAENNLPDENSVSATKELLEYIDKTCKIDTSIGFLSTFVILIGGGGSACLANPNFVSLQEKLNIIEYLQKKGADIVELNKVRRYFSRVKGGQLANYILHRGSNTRILSLILSDVIGNPVEFIASGPTFTPALEQPVRQLMLDVLHKFEYPDVDNLAEKCHDHVLTDSKHIIERAKKDVANYIIGDNMKALEAICHRAHVLGYHVEMLGNSLQGYTDTVVGKMCQVGDCLKLSKQDQKLLIVGGGEATIRKAANEGWGKGGRAQEMALDYLLLRKSYSQSDHYIDMFLAGSTDGQDGPTDIAGSLVSHADWHVFASEANLQDLDDLAARAKFRHNSYNFWQSTRPDWLIRTGMTETNVMDIYMLMLCKVP